MSKPSRPPLQGAGRETKTLHFQIKAMGEAVNDAGQQVGQIEAYGAMFGNVDEGNDRILKGAFTRTLQNSKARAKARQRKYVVPMLWQHDTNELIGGWHDLKEDDRGLLCLGDVLLDTQRGQEYYALAKAGMTDQFSIIYDIPQGGAKYDKSGVRDLTELRLYSVDPVTFAMNDETLLVGVKSAEKGKHMDPKQKPKKTLMEHYNEEMAEDLLEDWQDVYVCSLTNAILDALKIGDQPQADIAQALDDFKTLVMDKFVAQAVEVGLPQYLSDNTYSSSPGDYAMQYGAESRPDYGDYGYMSNPRARRALRKAGATFSAANRTAIQAHIDGLHDVANKAMKDMQMHTKAVHSAADDLATVLQGSEAAYGTDAGTPDADEQEGKSAAPRAGARGTQPRPSTQEDTASEDIERGLAIIKGLRTNR